MHGFGTQAPLRPPARQQDPKQPIPTTEARATSLAALKHRNLMAQRDRSNSSAVRVRGSLRATKAARLVGIGIFVLLVLAVLARLGKFTSGNYTPVEVTGLYWHFVDIVWIFLFPLMYLAGHR